MLPARPFPATPPPGPTHPHLQAPPHPSYPSGRPARPKFLLLKNLPQLFSESEIKAILIDTVTLERVHLCPTSKNVYVKFGDVREMRSIVAENEQRPLTVNNSQIKMSIVNKIPLDLNQGSRIVLVTVYHDKVPINVGVIHALAVLFGHVNRIAIYKKKSFQALVEFRERTDAEAFVRAYDNRDFPGQFYLRAQFTQKEVLVVSANTMLEHDYTLSPAEGKEEAEAPKPEPGFRLTWTTLPERSDPQTQSQVRGNPPARSWRASESPESLSESFRQSNTRKSRSRPASSERKPGPDAHLGARSRRRSNSFHSQASLSRQDEPDDSQSAIEALSGDPPLLQRLSSSEPVFGILISNLPPQMGHKQVFNLFSLYGNIEKVLTNPSERMAVVVYSAQNEQATAFQFLFDIPVFETRLDLQTVSRWTAAFATPAWVPVSYKKSEHFSPEKYADRAKSITKPNTTLYVFNLTKAADLGLIRELFEQRRRVVHIEYLNESKNSCLVYLESVEAAATILATFKNISVLDKGLKINFANEMKAQAKLKGASKKGHAQGQVARSLTTTQQPLPRRRYDTDDESELQAEEMDQVRFEAETPVRTSVNPILAKRRVSRWSTASGDRLDAL